MTGFLSTFSDNQLVKFGNVVSHITFNTCKLNRVPDENGDRNIITLVDNSLSIEFDERLTSRDHITGSRMNFKMTALEVIRFQTNMYKHVQAIYGSECHRMTSRENRFDFDGGRSDHAITCRPNGNTLTKVSRGKRLIIHLGKRDDISLKRRTQHNASPRQAK